MKVLAPALVAILVVGFILGVIFGLTLQMKWVLDDCTEQNRFAVGAIDIHCYPEVRRAH